MPLHVRIAATAPVPAVAHTAFAALGEIAVMDGAHRDALREAEVLIARAEPVGEDMLSEARALRAIARTGAGLDTIDVDAVTERGVPLLYAPDAGALAMAEGTLTLILACMKRLGELGRALSKESWDRRYEIDILDLSGAKLGIVGLGRIGRELARLAQALGMEVIAYDPRPETFAVASGDVAERSLEGLFSEAEVVSLHCPLNFATRGMVDGDLLAALQPGAILVNASRGGLIASDSVLLEALESGTLSAIGLDVFPSEPPASSSRLLADPRVVATPHAVGLTRSWNRKVFDSLARDVARVLAGERPKHIANPEVLGAASDPAA